MVLNRRWTRSRDFIPGMSLLLIEIMALCMLDRAQGYATVVDAHRLVPGPEKDFRP